MHEPQEEGRVGPVQVQVHHNSSSDLVDEQSQGICRLCLEEESVNCLVACCGCIGSIKYIHPKCLQQWQHTLWVQGQFSRALRCDLCCRPYQQPQLPVNEQLPLWQRVKQQLMQLYHNPEWAFKAWRGCILLGGLAAGTHRGVAGFGAGLNFGLRMARPLASFTFRMMPQLSVAAAVLPSLAPMLRSALRCSCCLILLEVAVTTAAGLLGGGMLGFCLGSVGVVRFTARISCHAAAVAAKVAAGASRAAWPRALALVLLKGGRGLLAPGLGQRQAAQALL